MKERVSPDVQTGSATFVRVHPGEGQQGDLPGLFDSRRNDALMPRARPGLPARADSSVIADILAKQVGFLVINRQGFVCAELAELGFGKETALAAFAAL